MHKIIFFPEKICLASLPKNFRHVTRNTLIFYLALLAGIKDNEQDKG